MLDVVSVEFKDPVMLVEEAVVLTWRIWLRSLLFLAFIASFQSFMSRNYAAF